MCNIHIASIFMVCKLEEVCMTVKWLIWVIIKVRKKFHLLSVMNQLLHNDNHGKQVSLFVTLIISQILIEAQLSYREFKTGKLRNKWAIPFKAAASSFVYISVWLTSITWQNWVRKQPYVYLAWELCHRWRTAAARNKTSFSCTHSITSTLWTTALKSCDFGFIIIFMLSMSAWIAWNHICNDGLTGYKSLLVAFSCCLANGIQMF